MTDLQMGLIGIGIAIIVGVIIYNKVQEHRARKEVERAFSGPFDDVLMKTASAAGETAEKTKAKKEPEVFSNESMHSREATFEKGLKEPVLGEEPAPDTHERAVDTPPLEDPVLPASEVAPEADAGPVSEVIPAETKSASEAIREHGRDAGIDDLIDYAVSLNLEEPVRGDKILPLLQTLRVIGNKPVHYMGLVKETKGEEAMEEWQTITHSSVYHQLLAGVQMANRKNALNEIEYSEFILRLGELADKIGAEPNVPDMQEVIQIARSLYQFVAEHDARLGVNVKTNGAPWAIDTLTLVLERQGFELRPDNQYVMRDASGALLFTLSTSEPPASPTISKVTLLMDVPCVMQERDPFNVMLQCAKALCERLDGSLVDDGNNVLTDDILKEIGEQVNSFYEEMKAMSIPAGSTRALRLFLASDAG